jgi:hypothetical protein
MELREKLGRRVHLQQGLAMHAHDADRGGRRVAAERDHPRLDPDLAGQRREFVVNFSRYMDGRSTSIGDVIYLANTMLMPDGRKPVFNGERLRRRVLRADAQDRDRGRRAEEWTVENSGGGWTHPMHIHQHGFPP